MHVDERRLHRAPQGMRAQHGVLTYLVPKLQSDPDMVADDLAGQIPLFRGGVGNLKNVCTSLEAAAT